MKIIVIADTHKDYDRYNNIVMKNKADLYIHLGDGINEFSDVAKENPDKEFVFVKGETDFCEASITRVIKVKNCKIFCAHGNTFNVTEGLNRILSAAKAEGCSIVLFGHTHLYKAELIDGLYVLNPGSLGTPRGHNKASYGILEIGDDSSVKMNIVAY